MTHIELHDALPLVFAEHAESIRSRSEVWLRNLTLERGRYYLLEAESGAGKSSFCSFVYGYRSDYQGQIHLSGTEARRLSRRRWAEIRRSEISLLWQELRLFPTLTAWENLLVKNQLTHYKTDVELRQLVDLLGLGERIHQPASKLSLGQRQRLAIIRCLCQSFDFLLLDEPISHLDDANAALVATLLIEEAEARGAAIIATSVGKHLPIDYHHRLKL